MTAKLKVYIGGVPAHVQVYVHPGGVAVDYIDDEGEVETSVVHDAKDMPKIAEKLGAEIEEVEIGPEVESPTAAAAIKNAAEAAGSPITEPDADAEDGPEDLSTRSVKALKAMAKAAGIKGFSSMDKRALIEALNG
jgi:hypothetical protein